MSPIALQAAEFAGVVASVNGKVVRTASTTDAPLGVLASGQQIFAGDAIKVEGEGGLQVMLRDETTFTLGNNAEFLVDDFVMDSGSESLTASVTQGAFRFISGKIAAKGEDTMKVNLPDAVIGVRGTQVAGEVEEDGSANVVLIGPGPNSFGAIPGAINISNGMGSVDVMRAGYVVAIEPSLPPAPPVPAPPSLIDRLQSAINELAGEEVSAAVIAANATPEVLALAEALVESGARGDDATNDAAVRDVIFAGTDTTNATDLDSINFTGEAAYLILTAFGGTDLTNAPAGPSPTDLQGLSGSYRYTANNVQMTLLSESNGGLVAYPSNNSTSGTFDSVTTWDFGGGTLTSQINGSVANLPTDLTSTVSFDFVYTGTESISSINSVASLDSTGNSTDTSATSQWATGAIALTSATASVSGTGDALDFVSPSCSAGVSCGSTQTGTLSLTNIQATDTNDSLYFSTSTGVISALNTGDVGFTNATFTTEDTPTLTGYELGGSATWDHDGDGGTTTAEIPVTATTPGAVAVYSSYNDTVNPNLGGTGVAAAQQIQ